MKHRIPNLLTYSRIAAIPLFVASFYMGPHWQWAPLALFIYASITDFLDGYLARKWNVISDIGRVLDPIADKLLVAAALVMLLVNEAFGGMKMLLLISALIILSREIFVSGLREVLENKNITLHVSRLGKWKTATQMIAVGVLLFAYGFNLIPSPLNPLCGVEIWVIPAGVCFLILAALLTAITGIEYTVKGFRALKEVTHS